MAYVLYVDEDLLARRDARSAQSAYENENKKLGRQPITTPQRVSLYLLHERKPLMASLKLDRNRCTKCGKCVVACPNNAIVMRNFPAFCKHCDLKAAPCYQACPLGAIVDVGNGILKVDVNRCDPYQCKKECQKWCQWDGVFVFGDKAKKCDLCFDYQNQPNFIPKCIEVCDAKAITTDLMQEVVLDYAGWSAESIPQEIIAEVLQSFTYGQVVKVQGQPVPYYYVNSLPQLTDWAQTKLLGLTIKKYIDTGKADQDPFSSLMMIMRKSAQWVGTSVDENMLKELANIALMNTKGYGPFDVLLEDDQLEELMCIGLGKERPMYVYHREYGMLRTNLFFPDEYMDFTVDPPEKKSGEEVLWKIIEKMIEPMGERIDRQHPRVNAQLPDGSRLHACIKPMGFSGPSVTIRKFRAAPFSPIDTIRFNTISLEAVVYCWIAMESEISMIVAGNTGSGKTTSLNAFSTFIPPEERILILESTPEINLPHPHKARLVTVNNADPPIGMQDIIEDTLRMRPDRVVVGEVRSGPEAQAFMNSVLAGQARGSMCTFHAQDAVSVVKRMKNPPMNISPLDLQVLDLVFVQRRMSRVEGSKRKQIRRVVEIAEIDKHNMSDEGVPVIHPIYRYNPDTDVVERVHSGLSPLEERISKYNLCLDEGQFWGEVQARTKMLKYLMANNIRDIKVFMDYIIQYGTDPAFKQSIINMNI